MKFIDKIVGKKEKQEQMPQNQNSAPLDKIVVKLAEVLEDRIIEVDRVVINNDTLQKIEALNSKLHVVEEVSQRLKSTDEMTIQNDALSKANNELTALVDEQKNEIVNLKSELRKTIKENEILVDRITSIREGSSIEHVKQKYQELLEFAFHNINPVNNIDQKEARFYWENAIK